MCVKGTCKFWHVLIKSKITKILNSEENSIGKSLITWQNQRIKRIKRMDNNCLIPGLVQAFIERERPHFSLILRRDKKKLYMIDL